MPWYRDTVSDFNEDIASIPRITRIKLVDAPGGNPDAQQMILQSNTTGTNKIIETFSIVKSFRERGDHTYITKPTDGGENSRLIFVFDKLLRESHAVLDVSRTENGVETKKQKFILVGYPLRIGVRDFLRPAPSPVVPPPPPPKIKVPKGQTDCLTEEEITEGMEMVDFNKEREERNRYYTKKSYTEGVLAKRQNPWTREPIKPESVVNYIAEIDPNMPVVGGRRRNMRKTRRRKVRRRTVRR
jgi:hypothetical protein